MAVTVPSEMFLTPLTPAGKSSAFAGRRLTMQKYVCNVCGYEYDPAAGYSQMYGGAVIYEWRLDAVSLYSLKGIRL